MSTNWVILDSDGRPVGRVVSTVAPVAGPGQTVVQRNFTPQEQVDKDRRRERRREEIAAAREARFDAIQAKVDLVVDPVTQDALDDILEALRNG